MKRYLILIGNEGSPVEGNFLPGVKQDIDRYRNFFKSDFGGAWENIEIEPKNYGWTRKELRDKLSLRIKHSRINYALIIFAGHGYGERNGEVFFELSKGEEISLSEIKSWLPNQKMLMIADSCQAYSDEIISESINESVRTFSSGVSILNPRYHYRKIYNSLIEKLPENFKVFVSAVSTGEFAKDTSRGGLYSRTLMDLVENIIDSCDARGIYLSINILHDLVLEEVSQNTNKQQNPDLDPKDSKIYPPFLII